MNDILGIVAALILVAIMVCGIGSGVLYLGRKADEEQLWVEEQHIILHKECVIAEKKNDFRREGR